jgi:tetratricopeptide (TPR) repeat protein
MKNLLIIYLFFVSVFSFSQEKRLALVIGNSNYEKGELKNPVNDAKLIAKTLDSLGFDVIEKYNLATQLEFKNAIKEFGTRRENYEVGFVYYAGHGIQVNDENFMLPTKVSFNSEIDVQEDGVSVKSIMRYLESKSSQVNILILDACRDNPFETTWKKTRSVKGDGLAKLLPPSGSLIAFSTEPGNTAADGEKENSIYCISLAKNLKLENTSLDQVFRNVRREVLETSNNFQRPIEASQLTGSTFYLVKSNFSKEFDKIESLISNNKNKEAKILIDNIILKESNNKRAYKLMGDNYFAQKNYEQAIESYNTAIKIDTNYVSAITQKTIVYEKIADNYGSLGDYQMQNEYYKKSLEEINKLIILDENNKDLYNRRGIIYHYYFDDTINGLNDYNKSIQIDPFFIKPYINRANLYSEIGEKEKVLNDFNKAISLIPNSNELSKLNIATLNESIAGFYFENNNLNNALIYLTKAIESDPQYDLPYLRRAKVYKAQNDTIKSEIDLNKYIELQPFTMAGFAIKRDAYIDFDQIDKAILCSTNIILYLPNTATNYYTRGTLYEKINQYEKALVDYNKAIELEPKNSDWLFNRAFLYQTMEQYDKSLSDYLKIIEMDSTQTNAFNNVALIYKDYIKNYEKALEFFNKKIELEPTDPLGYSNRGHLYENELNQFDKALEDYNKAIELEPKNSDWLFNRAFLYQTMEQYDISLSDYLKIIEMDSTQTSAFNNVALIYKDYIKNYEKALEFFNKKIELEPTDPLGYSNRADLYRFNLKNNDKALLDYNKAIELSPDDSAHYNERGRFYEEELKQYDRALSDYLKIIEIDPKNSQALLSIGSIYEEYIKRYDIAIEYYSKAIEFEAKNAYYYNQRGTFYYNQKEYNKAMLDYNKSIELEPDESIWYFYRGVLYTFVLNNIDKGLSDFNKAIELDPKNATYYNRRGILYRVKLKEYNKALDDYNYAINLDPNFNEAYTNRAILYLFNLNDIENSLINYNKAIELKPDDFDGYNYRINYFIVTKNYEKAFQDADFAINKDSKKPEPFYKKALIYEAQNKYLLAIFQLTIAIQKLIENPLENNILDFEEIDKLDLADLYLYRANLSKKFNDLDTMCEDYKNALEFLKDNPTKKKEIEFLIKENCK